MPFPNAGRSVSLGLALLAVFVFLSIRSPVFLTTQNLLNVGLAVSLVGLVAAMSTAVLISGSLDLSLGATVAISGMVGATLLEHSLPLYLAIPATIATGLVIGALNGFLVVFVGVNPFIATIGTAFMLRGIAYLVNGGRSVAVSSSDFLYIGQERLFGVPIPIYFMFAMFVVVWHGLNNTRWGIRVHAVGGSESAAARAGVSVRRLRVAIYVLSSASASLAGYLMASQAGSAFPYAAQGFELDVLAAVILGGTSLYGGSGSVVGTLLGVALLGFLFNGINLLELDAYWQDVARGAVLIVAVSIDSIRRERGRSHE